MRHAPTPIADLWLVELDLRPDERGSFESLWRRDEAPTAWRTREIDQVCVATNTLRGTLRGMHFQIAPHAQAKFICVRRGEIQDVVVDLRPEQSTFGQHYGVRLSAENRQGLLVPPGCAHGYLTLAEDTEVLYLLSGRHVAEAERGIRWDSPALADAWLETPTVVSQRDQQWPTDASTR